MRKTNSFSALLLILLMGACLVSPILARNSATLIKTSNKNLLDEKIPFAARKPLNTANRLLKSLETNLKNLSDPAYTGNKDQLVDNIEKKLVQVRESLAEAKKLAAEKGVTSHPDFDAVDAKIGNAEMSIASAKSGHEANKAAAAASPG